MSTFEVTLETIEVLPHPNADALELARVGGYKSVIPKGKYKTGDTVIYIPEQAVLPQELVSFLGLEGKLSGSDKNRVKPVRLRGELSQGIVMSVEDAVSYVDKYFPNSNTIEFNVSNNGDWQTALGIVKWIPPIPAEMAGQVIHVNSIVKWPDIENIKKHPDMFEPGEPVDITEKVHGTCCGMSYDMETDIFAVYSKGMGQQGMALVESDTNLYWRAVHKYKLDDKLRMLCNNYNASRMALFGEVYGQGVQDLGYGVNQGTDGPGFAAFDLWAMVKVKDENGFIEDEQSGFFKPEDFYKDTYSLDIPAVPVLGAAVPYDYDLIWKEYASGKTRFNADHIREGVVVRPRSGDQKIRHENPNDPTKFSESRRIAKFVSDDYLLRKGNTTEYE